MIVVQCWDDGVTDDLKVMDVCRRHNAKATFNLNTGLHPARRAVISKRPCGREVSKFGLDELARVYQGFDIANHGDFHKTAGKVPIGEWRADVVDGKRKLEDIFGFQIRGFAYSCGGFNEEAKQVLRDVGHTYARTTVNSPRPFPPADPMELATHCHFMNADFEKIYEKAKEDKCEVFYFWGHAYEMDTSEQLAEFERRIAMISADPSAVWAHVADLFERK